MNLCEHCGTKPIAGHVDDIGREIRLCDDCHSKAGEAQDERRREA
jgi:ribosome-binding protein aMBF1 (putative translation factor)